MPETVLSFRWTSEYSKKVDSWELLAFALGLVAIAIMENTELGPRKEVNEAVLLLEELTGQEMVFP
jgi:hypothetical protein